MKKYILAFTLAEIMIVLTVIGVLTAILLPAAFHATPDENIMKFKKANSTLGTVIRELVNSDEYYANGDLGKKADGTLIDGTHEGDVTYFCESFADILSVKSKNCSQAVITSSAITQYQAILNIEDGEYQSIETAALSADETCKKSAKTIGSEIITPDNVVFYQTAPNFTFGLPWKKSLEYTADTICDNSPNDVVVDVCLNGRLFSGPEKIWHKNASGFDRVYKIFCIDVDGIPTEATEDDCVNECPFGYGIRGDGKIFPGARATEWIQKSVQKDT